VTRETVVVHGRHGLPFSKGLSAQTLSATGVGPERAFELARLVERRLAREGLRRIDLAELHALTEEVVLAEEGEAAARRLRDWRRLDRLERPLVVLIGGTTGVGKSTLATLLAARLGITRVIASDTVRQVLRAYFTHDAMPSVQRSAFEAGIDGFREQAVHVEVGTSAIVARACSEGQPVLVEGIHVVPGALPEAVRDACVVVEVLVTVSDEELHRARFSLRRGRPSERYLSRFGEIRRLQDHLVGCALAVGVPVIDNSDADATLGRLMGLALDAVAR
jgi:2-phosphoglycerate kinase